MMQTCKISKNRGHAIKNEEKNDQRRMKDQVWEEFEGLIPAYDLYHL